MKNMGIREKIRLGFLALGLLLFFSGLISFFELSKLSRSTQSMLGASLKNMELSKTMLDAVQDQNTALLQIIVSGRSDRESDSLLHAGREKFEAAISDAKISIRDLQGFDSVYAANISYNETVGAYLRDSLRKENVGLVRRYLQDLLFGPDLLDQEFHGLVPEYDGCQGRGGWRTMPTGRRCPDSSRW